MALFVLKQERCNYNIILSRQSTVSPYSGYITANKQKKLAIQVANYSYVQYNYYHFLAKTVLSIASLDSKL